MTIARSKLIWRWLTGAILGTLAIAVTSPLFLRSYLSRTVDSLRQVRVLQPGSHYRWRSEGYANTFIGPHGMPGRSDVPAATGDSVRLAIWGDSQAEGVCVDDADKLYAQIEQSSEHGITALPLARSGDDLSDWIRQIPHVDQGLDIDVHVLLVVELNDLIVSTESQSDPEDETFKLEIADKLPAFVIEPARRLLTDANDRPRRLRFSVGPIEPDSSPSPTSRASTSKVDWEVAIGKLKAATNQPIMMVYCPIVPNITQGRMRSHDASSRDFEWLQVVAIENQCLIVDMREAMRNSVATGRWPFGFHNGNIGSGHLNRIGYRIIAEQLVAAMKKTAGRE